MFKCENCKNKDVCKNVNTANKLQEEAKNLEKKYKEFFGRVNVICDYFIPEGLSRSLKG